jgi:ABC-2 type transport system ATP-binding protein
MRTLLREYADRGGTVLLSSHLLHEVEAVADLLVVINEGQMVANGPTAQLKGPHRTLVRTLDPAGLAAALREAGHNFTGSTGGTLTVDASTEQVGRAAARAGAVLTELRPQGADLESLFLRAWPQPSRRARRP